jgi:phosphatidate phosphatase APP1
LARISPHKIKTDDRRAPPFADVLLARLIRNLKKYTGLLRPFTILPFRGYGCDDSIVICGRVIESLDIGSPKQEDSWWKNLRNMFRVFLRARAEKATLSFTISGQSMPITTDDMGFFWAEIPLQKILGHPGWIAIDFELDPMRGYGEIREQTGSMLSIPSCATFATGIISDIDDTILETNATDLLMSAKLTFIKNSTTRIAVEGMSALYNCIVEAAAPRISPVFYITSSSWSLYDLMSDFLDLQHFPKGPLLMQKIGLTNNKLIRKGHNHKILKIENILKTIKNLSFFLFGDNGQADRQIYFEIASRYPDRIKAVCIRVARAKAKPFAADYESIGIPYFEFEDGFSLQARLTEVGLLPQSQT